MGKNTDKGLFITFEGTEGCGKSTHVKLLKQFLDQNNIRSVVTFEPGGTPVGQKIRKLLLDKTATFHENAELLLFGADRIEHVSTVIKPALKEGKSVICDRYIDSTTAYQEGGRGLPKDRVEFINGLSSQGVVPDITIILDLPSSEGLKRVKESVRDRFESESMDFHDRVRNKFLDIARAEPHRVKVVSSIESIDTVQGKIREIVREYL